MEKHDDEKGELLSREEMKHTKGGMKIVDLGGEGKLPPGEFKKELLDGELDGSLLDDDYAKGSKQKLKDI